MKAAGGGRCSSHRQIMFLPSFIASCIIAGILFATTSTPMAQTNPVATAPPRPPALIDITTSTGIHFEHLASPDQKYIVESMSGGVALFDYDGDGWLDIYFTNSPSVSMALAGKKAKSAL